MSDLIDKIEKLEKKFADPNYNYESTMFKAWKEQATRDALILNLREHEAVKWLIAALRKEVDEMNAVLSRSRSASLPDRERDRIMDRRDMYQWFLTFFDLADMSQKALEKQVDQNLAANADK